MHSNAHKMGENFKLFTCTANVPLAKSIADELGMPLAQAEVRRFSDGEIFVEVHESVRGCDTFVVQPTCHPINDSLMELLHPGGSFGAGRPIYRRFKSTGDLSLLIIERSSQRRH